MLNLTSFVINAVRLTVETVGNSRRVNVITPRIRRLTGGITPHIRRMQVKMKREEPCSVDGESCLWASEEEYTADGNLVEDVYCEKCFRYMD